MASTLFVDVHRGLGEGAGHVAHPTGVVQVDVGDHHPGQVLGPEAQLFQLGQQHGHRALAARLHQDGCRTLDEVAGGHSLPAAQQRVELDDPCGDTGPHLAIADRSGIGGVVMGVRVGMGAAHEGVTSITTLTSSGFRSSASGQESRGTLLLTTLASHASSALANASAAAS
jgi:hypothetical protein